MSIVNLSSGGIDSTLVAVMLKEKEIEQFPLFINYGQLAAKMEWKACRRNFKKHNMPEPNYINVSGFGKVILSGLTDRKLKIKEDAFLPNRNMLFLLLASSYAYQVGANTITIGLLDEKKHIFPDQTSVFIKIAEESISESLGSKIKVLAPLIGFSKAEVIELANKKGINHTYSCHAGTKKPCGECISCLEIINSKRED